MASRMTRRELISLCLGAGAGALTLGRSSTLEAQVKPKAAKPTTVSHANLPRWRGFNLLEKFTLARNSPYREADFDLITDWGFDFARLPTDYRCWTEAPGTYKEAVLKEIDQAVAWGRARSVHVNLCLHRAPGYCINPPKEPLDLWDDGASGEEARRQFAAQWGMFAARYKGIPSTQLSFDLVNEPSGTTATPYVRAVTAAVDAIRAADPQRLIIADGLRTGNQPVPDLIALRVALIYRGNYPSRISLN